MAKTYTIYEVCYHDDNRPYGGAFGDGSFVSRFRKRSDAEKFAAGRHYYSGPASVTETNAVPKRLMDRWGL